MFVLDVFTNNKMYTTLLFKESPVISNITILLCFLSAIYKSYILFCFFMIILIFLVIFYRYKPHNKRYSDNIIVSPADGVVSYLKQECGKINVSIYLNFLNNHTQIYPVNGIVIKRIYDNTGLFYLANNNKTRFNEKKIHTIQMKNNKILKVTQIAGFFPRRIVSSKTTPEEVMAGEYLGMIKFGSRIDLEFEGNISNILIKEGQSISIGDFLYSY